MTFRTAKKLHNEDEVISKATQASLYVVSVRVDEAMKTVWILCDDGNEYHHRDVR